MLIWCYTSAYIAKNIFSKTVMQCTVLVCDHLSINTLQTIMQTPIPNAEFTRRLYSVHAARSQRAHGALEDPTTLPQCAV